MVMVVTDANVKAQDTSMSSDASTLPPSLEVYDEQIRMAVEVESDVESGADNMMIPPAYQAPLVVFVSLLF